MRYDFCFIVGASLFATLIPLHALLWPKVIEKIGIIKKALFETIGTMLSESIVKLMQEGSQLGQPENSDSQMSQFKELMKTFYTDQFLLMNDKIDDVSAIEKPIYWFNDASRSIVISAALFLATGLSPHINLEKFAVATLIGASISLIWAMIQVLRVCRKL